MTAQAAEVSRHHPRRTGRPTGRPSKYTEAIGADICRRLEEGETLYAMCRDDDRLPALSTVYRWLEAHAGFREIYARARRCMAATIIDKAMHAADQASDKDNSAAARVKTDTFFRAAACLDPERWAPKPSIGPALSVQILTSLDGVQTSADGGYVVDISPAPIAELPAPGQVAEPASMSPAGQSVRPRRSRRKQDQGVSS